MFLITVALYCVHWLILEYIEEGLFNHDDKLYGLSSCSFAVQFNEVIEKEVKNRKMWLNENQSWMNISDNDADDLPGFAKKLDEQKVLSSS